MATQENNAKRLNDASLSPESLITEHLNLWTNAIKPTASSRRGRGKGSGNGRYEIYGIKKLRELILELAVRGLLVPQDPNDEPASELLKNINAEKDKLIKEGKIKKSKPLSPISLDEVTFPIPRGWELTRLGEIVSIVRGITFPASQKNLGYSEGLIACLRTANVQDEIDWNDLIYVDKKFIKRDEQLVNVGDIVMSMANSRELVGKVSIIKNVETGIASFGGFLGVIRPYHILPEFLMLFLRSPSVRVSLIDSASQTTNIANISLSKLNPLITYVPPLLEQERIVHKAQSLMILCDQLEEQKEQSIEAHKQLVETLLNTLTNAKDHQAFSQAWERVAENFDILFTTEDSIEQLKQTILQLAVMGKLVPQDPSDEPACELLKKIATEKQKLIKEGKIKKQKPQPPVTDEEKPFELPTGWQWCRLGYLAEFVNGDRGKNYPNKSEYVESGVPWINTGHIESNGTLATSGMNYITKEKFESLKSGKIQKGDLVYCLRGATFGKTAFVEPYDCGAIASSLMIIRPHDKKMIRFIYKYLISDLGRSQIFRFDNGTAQPNLSANSVKLFVFPVPPITEQERIISKVGELLGLFDSLKKQIEDSKEIELKLADAFVENVA